MFETAEPLRGLQKACRLYGRMKCGDTVMVWDYANEVAVPASEMPRGSERWKISEKAKRPNYMTSSSKPDGEVVQPISEAELRALRDRVFGMPMSDKEWQICKVNWANPETLKWLQNLDAADEAYRRSMVNKQI